MTKPRVIIADDHQLFVDGLERLLAPECEVARSVSDGQRLLDAIRELRPEIILLDLSIPPLNGIDMIPEIRAIDAGVKIVVVTMCEDSDVAAEAFRRGASAYVLKSSGASDLLESVRSVLAMKTYVTPVMARNMLKSMVRSLQDSDQAKPQLTQRQREVLRLLAAGRSMKQVAALLGLSPRTVAFHKYQMMQTLDITSSAELVRFAVEHKIV